MSKHSTLARSDKSRLWLNFATSCTLLNCKYRDFWASSRRRPMLCNSCRARSSIRENLSRMRRRVAMRNLSFQTPSRSNSTWNLPSTLAARTCNWWRSIELTTCACTRLTWQCRRWSNTSSLASLWTRPCAGSHPRWLARSRSSKIPL